MTYLLKILMSMPESEDTSTAANHSFPANTSHNSETRRKKPGTFSVAGIGRKKN